MANPFDLPDVVTTIQHNGRLHTLFSDGTLLPVVSGGDGPLDDGGDEPAEEQVIDSLVVEVPPVETPPAPAFDPNDPVVKAAIEKARKEEKDKLYSRIEKEKAEREALAAQIAEINKEREAAAKERAKAEKAAEEARKKAELEEMTAAEKIAAYQADVDAKIAALEAEREAERALFERERAFNQLKDYRQQRLAELADQIAPEFHDYVRGETVEEVEESLALAAQKTSGILQQMEALASAAQRPPAPRGVSPTQPPVGPMENEETHQTLTAEDIRNMDMETYQRYRQQLLSAASRRGPYGG